ncbi:MAG: sensor histidine kinase [Weeksellaceae bacterium]
MSPHFLFNALNAIYTLTYKKSPKAPAAVMQLSDLMRYMLYEKSTKIELEKEWQMALSYLELQKLRITNNLLTEITTQGDLSTVNIPPYTLIPFLENAFKHGDFNSSHAPLAIKLIVKDDTIQFYCKNKIASNKRHTQTGIGIENLRKRLAIIYPHNFKLKLHKTSNNEFEAYLCIN